MKKYLIGSVVGLLVLAAGMISKNARADVAYCLLEGYVQLDYVTSDWIEGTIGGKPVGFAFYQSFIYGDIENHKVELHEMRNSTVVGTVGGFNVRWYTDGKHIFGYQKCLMVLPSWH